jgi:hydrogenase-4 component F
VNFFISVTAIPLATVILSLTKLKVEQLRLVVPVMSWLQFGVLTFLSLPALQNNHSFLTFSVDFSIEKIGACFLLLTNFIAAASITHATCFFANEKLVGRGEDPQHEKLYYAACALFVTAMSFVFLSDNLGLLWVSIEATTLFSAALVYFSRDKHSLEATWKYLIICSVGIAFALLGIILIFASSQHGAIAGGSLSLRLLVDHANELQPKLLQFGYIFCLLGFGTKAGVFPLHTWLPDAHSEAPAPASALLSGALLNCALFSICRVTEIIQVSGHSFFATFLPISWGALTALAASFFLIHQVGIKRLWAYSSIENVGIMLVAIGLGSPPLFFFQALNHSLAKVALFLLSGNIIQSAGTKELKQIKGILQVSPSWGITFAAAAAAVTGMPPFGSFVAEWMILSHCGDLVQRIAAGVLLFALALSFIAVSLHVGRILWGKPKHQIAVLPTFSSTLIPLLLCIFSLLAGSTCLPTFFFD